MITSELTGKTVPDFDVEIRTFLEKRTFDGGGNKMVIGVENDAGDIYRRIEAIGLGDFMSMIACLQNLELEDVLADSLGMVGGFDCRFRPVDRQAS